jgi:Uma2 family endonuclease
MNALKITDLISEADYLAGELASPIKHEYLAGAIYPMPGATNAHNRIATNILVALNQRIKDGPCEVFNSDTKVRIRLPEETRFYYPDALVTCRPNPQEDSCQDEPAIVAEVLSASTRRLDLGEKKDAYVTISSLQFYMAVEQEAAFVHVFRRTDAGFVREEYQELDAVIPLESLQIELPLAEIYRKVNVAAEPS